MQDQDRKRRKCCFCLPQEPWIKLWFVWTLVAMITAPMNVIKDPRIGIPYLPAMCVAIIILLFMAIVFFHPGFDTYGTRMVVFWTWVNGWLFGNIYLIFLSTNSFWWNDKHFVCLDKTSNQYSQEYIDCMEEEGGNATMTLLFGILLDIWGAIELYRWAQNLRDD